jgi:hypothetical protein
MLLHRARRYEINATRTTRIGHKTNERRVLKDRWQFCNFFLWPVRTSWAWRWPAAARTWRREGSASACRPAGGAARALGLQGRLGQGPARPAAWPAATRNGSGRAVRAKGRGRALGRRTGVAEPQRGAHVASGQGRGAGRRGDRRKQDDETTTSIDDLAEKEREVLGNR